jgi:hypothetical protein
MPNPDPLLPLTAAEIALLTNMVQQFVFEHPPEQDALSRCLALARTMPELRSKVQARDDLLQQLVVLQDVCGEFKPWLRGDPNGKYCGCGGSQADHDAKAAAVTQARELVGEETSK